MGSSQRDVGRFGRWAGTYEQSYLQRLVFEPVQRTVLEVAVAERRDAGAILDVGCGTGRLLRAAAAVFPSASLRGVDAAEEMAEVARRWAPAGRDVEFARAMAEALPFPDASFDLAFSTMTFHHWADQARGIEEVGRVLRPEGRWLLADFLPVGLMRLAKWGLRLRRFRRRAELDQMLGVADMRIARVCPVAGLWGQVPVVVIEKGR